MERASQSKRPDATSIKDWIDAIKVIDFAEENLAVALFDALNEAAASFSRILSVLGD